MHLSVFCGHVFLVKFHLFLFLRNDPPGQTCSQAVRKLTEFTQNVSSDIVPLEFVSQTKDIHLKDIDRVEDRNRLRVLEQKLTECTGTDIANFEHLVINTSHIYMYISFSTDQ
jgi:hypothetical protein